MKYYYEDKWVTIYHGDCREILPQLDVKVDLVLTDPPYGCSNDKDDVLDLSVFDKVVVKMTDGSGLFCFCGQETIDLFMAKLRQLQLAWLNTIVWRYDNTIPRERFRFAISYDPVLFYSKGKLKHFDLDSVRVPYKSKERLRNPVYKNGKPWYPNPLGALRKDVWEVPAVTSPAYTNEKVAHKWQKPIELLKPMILATTSEGDLILDPFLGSGTTCYCAKKLNRYSIGIEIEEKYCEIAAKRCMQESFEFDIPTKKQDEIQQEPMRLDL